MTSGLLKKAIGIANDRRTQRVPRLPHNTTSTVLRRSGKGFPACLGLFQRPARAALIGFVYVLLAIAVMLVDLTPARADSLILSFSGAQVTCPTQLPIPTPLPIMGTLPLTTPGVTDFFNCIVSVSGGGTFAVYGSIFATNTGSGATGFNSSLAFSATVVVESPVVDPLGVSVLVSVSQFYTIPTGFGTVDSNMFVNGACNVPMSSNVNFNSLTFTVNNSGPVLINPASMPCPVISPPSVEEVGVQGEGNLLFLANSGAATFPPGAAVGDAVTLVMQQVAGPNGGTGPLLPAPSVPFVFPVASGVPDLINTFIPPPDPSDGFVIVFAGDVRNAIDIDSMISDPTVNPFAYLFPFQSTASISLDAAGNTEVTFSTFSGLPISSSDVFCYNGPSTCNHNPHFGVNASAHACAGLTCPTLELLGQFWTNNPDIVFPSLSVAGPGLTGQAVSFVTLFAEVTSGGNTVGQWFLKPYSTNAPPLLCLSNNTAAGETLSNAGFLVTPVAILQSMNFGEEAPPGQPGSPFTNLPSLDGLFLPSGGNVCFTAPVEPDIAVTTGDPSGPGVMTVGVNLNNTGGVDASNVTISSITPISPATYVGPVLPLTVGNITAGTTASQNIQLNVAGFASGSIARFRINGSFQDSAGKTFQYSSVRGVKVP